MPHHVHDTLTAFGYPHSLVVDLDRWVVLLRPRQPTLGSLVLVAADPAMSVADLEHETQRDLGAAMEKVDRVLRAAMACDKVNYLMLMMVDPHVHFHVIPRYATPAAFDGGHYPDTAWPQPPALSAALDLPGPTVDRLRERLKAAFLAN